MKLRNGIVTKSNA